MHAKSAEYEYFAVHLKHNLIVKQKVTKAIDLDLSRQTAEPARAIFGIKQTIVVAGRGKAQKAPLRPVTRSAKDRLHSLDMHRFIFSGVEAFRKPDGSPALNSLPRPAGDLR